MITRRLTSLLNPLPSHRFPQFLYKIFASKTTITTTPSKAVIKLDEADLEETFIHGWGPGGQAINKTANCVYLKHLPTQISVKCQDGRDLQLNRKLARQRLRLRIDEHLNGEDSVLAQQRREHHAKENNRFSRAKRRLEMKASFKETLAAKLQLPNPKTDS